MSVSLETLDKLKKQI
jgi:hypothetical protein